MHHDDPLLFAMNLVRDAATDTGRIMTEFLDEDLPNDNDCLKIVSRITDGTPSRTTTYFSVNPTMAVHSVYTARHC